MEFESRIHKKHLPRLRSLSEAKRLENMPVDGHVMIYLRGTGSHGVFLARVVEKVITHQPKNPMVRIHREDTPKHRMLLGGGTTAVLLKERA